MPGTDFNVYIFNIAELNIVILKLNLIVISNL